MILEKHTECILEKDTGECILSASRPHSTSSHHTYDTFYLDLLRFQLQLCMSVRELYRSSLLDLRISAKDSRIEPGHRHVWIEQDLPILKVGKSWIGWRSSMLPY